MVELVQTLPTTPLLQARPSPAACWVLASSEASLDLDRVRLGEEERAGPREEEA